ncbi:MAG: hypothetical protein GF401_04130, partial [Chitinivibrionales bacterium]|nr:hypothetical protein [Chitinivibrionales bacterium]
MVHTTDVRKSERMIRILAFLIRRKPRKFSISDIHNMLCEFDMVSLRNVQRDLKELSEISESCVCCEMVQGKLHYFIEPDIRNKMTLPIRHNGLLALFLLKRLQPFFASKAQSLEEARDALKELSSDQYYDLFEDLDEQLEKSTFIFGEQSVLSLDNNLLAD